MENILINIEKLIQFGLNNCMIEKWDVEMVRNQIMDILEISEPLDKEIHIEIPETPVPILEEILQYCIYNNIIEDSITDRDMLDSRIMATLMPRPSELINRFYKIAREDGIERATDYYYTLSRNSNYIRTDRIAKNEYWLAETKVGELEITINLSKPEKDPKEIEKARSMSSANYPKCFLCIENVGYPGRLNHPARNNHRVIPVTLNEENWYLQYSPYVYYNEHSIIFNEKHIPMKISEDTFTRLLSFVEQFPHYFIGSNADLPIVGGSILSHDHFQGGHHTFPMEKAPIIKQFNKDNYNEVNIGIVKWPLSVIRLSSHNKEELINIANDILKNWRNYSDEDLEILAYTEEDGKKIPHNTITPIARMNTIGEYEIDLVLRNNRRNEKHPDGIFHPHKHLHHIKKENIGLIEVMGLAVLPARLKKELTLIEEILTGNIRDINKYDELEKHSEWIEQLRDKYILPIDIDKAKDIIRKEVGEIFAQVLECAGVYKMDEEGIEGMERFISCI
ncbi:MAG: UDP-glucose--hexose-1-phosphate uridylyltransferase [Vallitalea sp.]|jgi:UDPglucose--hexose-1-phosphate uridylyltransferase|nr:UDP-glucose--hexose-1-phosphate uridylyltransferase [Vallitalea sp.]